MYRYTVDNSLTYDSTDLVLFKTSPFACWMERLTVDNPDHGIPPDLGSSAPSNPVARQDEIADTLRAEGKRVRLIAWDEAEPARRKATLEAMREGVDFIVNGQLALGPLASPVNLLMRTSGYSELGDFLYLPCDTQVATKEDSIFRLCFLADLLHSLQGQLPPQMLVIRGGEDLVAVPTEEHIYHYRAVKQRFMAAMRDFRKHRMPDPAASAHFGRWSDCAREVLKQRLLREERQIQIAPADAGSHGDVGGAQAPAAGSEAVSELDGIGLEVPLRRAVGAGEGGYDLDDVRHGSRQTTDAAAGQRQSQTVTEQYTLAEQALMLAPRTCKPGSDLPGRSGLAGMAAELRPDDRANAPGRAGEVGSGEHQANRESDSGPGSEPRRRRTDAALDNLEFIGRSHMAGGRGRAPEVRLPPFTGTAPAPSLRAPRKPADVNRSFIDLDSNHCRTPQTILSTADANPRQDVCADLTESRAAPDKVGAGPGESARRVPFSDSLITGPDRER